MRESDGDPQLLYGVLPRARPAARSRPARVACMLAFAHRIEEELDGGRFASASEVARLLGVSRNRISQLLRLTRLAPDIQAEILFLETTGHEPVREKWLFEDVAVHLDWNDQRAAWVRVRRRPLRRSAP